MNNFFETLFLGGFDGLHIGHQLLFQNAEYPMGVIMMIEIPRKKQFIFPVDERINQIKHFYKPNDIIVYNVTQNNVTGEQFLKNSLLNKRINKIIVGSNFTFGSDRLSAIKLLPACKELKIIPVKKNVSSSKIKKYLSTGKLEIANNFLASCFCYEGNVVHGQHMSSKFNCPTANFLIPETSIKLFSGSYISVTKLQDSFYKSVTFVGQSKTFPNEKWSVQTHLLGTRSINLYGQEIKTYFIKFIRQNEKFKLIQDLKKSIIADVRIAKSFFAKNSLDENLARWKVFNL